MRLRRVIEVVFFIVGIALAVYMIMHMDSLAEAFIGLQIKVHGLFADNPDVFALSAIAVNGCELNDTVCVINAINKWVYESVVYNYSKLGEKFYGFNDILRYGGVCAHKVMVAMIMLDSIGVDGCKVQTEVTINDGVNIGHEWFECKVNKTHKMVCDPTNKENCTIQQIYIR